MPTNVINLKNLILASNLLHSMFYNVGVYLLYVVLRILSLFDPKIKKGCIGRSETFDILHKNIKKGERIFWYHCASLGEFEQGFPVFTELRKLYPTHKIILTFFSPSGYEIRKSTNVADIVTYLPIDTPKNAKRFIEYLNPELTIFVKYDIWPNYLLELKKRNLPSILISAAFRKSQPYFKWYGKTLRQALKSFDHIFVQNAASNKLLKTLDFQNSTVNGDTRFDRVLGQLHIDNTLTWLADFKNEALLVIFGSTWPEDEKNIIRYLNEKEHSGIKYLIVPHEIKENHIKSLENSLRINTSRFSALNAKNVNSLDVVILDTIGYLSKAYSYGDIAYVGGAAGKSGLHNILEPAVFSLPIIIGPNYNKFPEAKDLIASEGVFSVNSYSMFKEKVALLIANSILRNKMGKTNLDYIVKNSGAVIQILEYIRI